MKKRGLKPRFLGLLGGGDDPRVLIPWIIFGVGGCDGDHQAAMDVFGKDGFISLIVYEFPSVTTFEQVNVSTDVIISPWI